MNTKLNKSTISESDGLSETYAMECGSLDPPTKKFIADLQRAGFEYLNYVHPKSKILLVRSERERKNCVVKWMPTGISPLSAKKYVREILANTLVSSGHPNIVGFLESGNFGFHEYILLEQCDETLETWCRKHSSSLSARGLARMMFQLFCGLQHVHSCNLLHLDMHPCNVLIKHNNDFHVTNQSDFPSTLKLGDFGLSEPFNPPLNNNALHSPYLIPPELLGIKSTPHPTLKDVLDLKRLPISAFTTAQEVWSGMATLFVSVRLSSDRYWTTETADSIMTDLKNSKEEFRNRFGDCLCQLFCDVLLCEGPAMRPTSKDILDRLEKEFSADVLCECIVSGRGKVNLEPKSVHTEAIRVCTSILNAKRKARHNDFDDYLGVAMNWIQNKVFSAQVDQNVLATFHYSRGLCIMGPVQQAIGKCLNKGSTTQSEREFIVTANQRAEESFDQAHKLGNEQLQFSINNGRALLRLERIKHCKLNVRDQDTALNLGRQAVDDLFLSLQQAEAFGSFYAAYQHIRNISQLVFAVHNTVPNSWIIELNELKDMIEKAHRHIKQFEEINRMDFWRDSWALNVEKVKTLAALGEFCEAVTLCELMVIEVSLDCRDWMLVARTKDLLLEILLNKLHKLPEVATDPNYSSMIAAATVIVDLYRTHIAEISNTSFGEVNAMNHLGRISKCLEGHPIALEAAILLSHVHSHMAALQQSNQK